MPDKYCTLFTERNVPTTKIIQIDECKFFYSHITFQLVCI